MFAGTSSFLQDLRSLASFPPRPAAEGHRRLGEGLGVRAIPDILWCPVPAGPFLYGDKKEQRTIDYDYQISAYPVTNAQFQPFIDDPNGYNNPEWWTEAGWEWKGERAAPNEYGDPAFRLPNHPRIYVRWYEAVAYCNWLTAQLHPDLWASLVGTRHASSVPRWQTTPLHTIKGLIGLPTEQEWERAARGTDGRVYPWGDEFDPLKCNSSVGDNPIGQTSAVGLYESGISPVGAYDMSGNVWEWCLTQYDNESNDVNGTGVRVVRGGTWGSNQDGVRAAFRSNWYPNLGSVNRGFRVCAAPINNL
jgi:formylglycine-generating enzyme required for sulfatase activity